MLKKFMILALFVGLLSARVIVDSHGEKVQIPDEITLASPLHHTSLQISLMLGNKDKIAFNSPLVMPTPLLERVFPEIRLNPNISGLLANSVESIIASKPQVAFGPKMSIFFDENAKKQLEAAGIAVVSIHKFLQNLEQIKGQVRIIAEIFGGQSIKKAQEWLEFTDNNVKFVSQRVAGIKNKKRVLHLNARAGAYTAMGDNFVGAEFIRIAGGINVSTNLISKVWNAVNEEQIIIFNPDIILTNSSQSREDILKNEVFKDLRAVKTGQIFIVPSGVFSWVPPNAEGTLRVVWLAKILYPELFADLNLEAKVREFYAKFYDYDLSEDELELILNPK